MLPSGQKPSSLSKPLLCCMSSVSMLEKLSEWGDISQIYCLLVAPVTSIAQTASWRRQYLTHSSVCWELWNPFENTSTEKAHKCKERWKPDLCWRDQFSEFLGRDHRRWTVSWYCKKATKLEPKYWKIKYSNYHCIWEIETILLYRTSTYPRNQQTRMSTILQALNISFSMPVPPTLLIKGSLNQKVQGAVASLMMTEFFRNRLDKCSYFTEEQLPIFHELTTCYTDLTGSKSIP